MHRRVIAALAAVGVSTLAAASAGPASAAPKRADLTTPKAAVTGASSVAPGGRFAMTATVKNAGKAKAKASTAALVLSTDAKLDAKDARLGTASIAALKPKKTKAGLKLSGIVPMTLPGGRYSLLVCADANAKVKESNEKNNCSKGASVTVTTKPGPMTPPVQTPPGTTPPAPTPTTPAAPATPAPSTPTTPTPPTTTPTTPNPPAVLPVVSVADAEVAEGDTGLTDLSFTLTLDRAASAPVSVAVTSEGGTATAGVDFQPYAARVVFPAGSTVQTAVVRVIGDIVDEPDETLAVELSAPQGVTVGRTRGAGTIHDDDVPTPGPAQITADDVALKEGDEGDHPAKVTLRLSRALSADGHVRVKTMDGTATAGQDYRTVDQVVTFPKGALEASVDVPILGDGSPEADETVTVGFSEASGAEPAAPSSKITILDDDNTPDAPPKAPDAPALPPAADPATALGDAADKPAPADFAKATEFLYQGSAPIQKDVADGAVVDRRASVIRGRLVTAAGDPIPGAKISVSGRPELGYTSSRDDGGFDLAANGGGDVVLEIARAGYMTLQRTAQDAPWHDFTDLGDIVLRPFTRDVDDVKLDATQPQLASGPVVDDAAGRRRSTLLFLPGTEAEAVSDSGASTDLSTLAVRSTEYTAGTAGPDAMPGDLPPTSGFTYAVELSSDEAVRMGSAEVKFSKPVVSYVDNFLGFPVGTPVPTGSYDQDLGQWVPERNGRVVKMLGKTGDLADVDTDGDGQADAPSVLAAIGIGDVERRAIATRFSAGDEFWRVEVSHFTPWDYNWPYGPPKNAKQPKKKGFFDRLKNAACGRGGSIIECDSQVLRESVDVAGTPYSLEYASDRGQARLADRTAEVTIPDDVPDSVEDVRLHLSIAGRSIEAGGFRAGQHASVTWDGKDAYGRTVAHPTVGTLEIIYRYPLVYQAAADFASSFSRLSGVPLRTDRAGMTIDTIAEQKVTLGGYDARTERLGGWTLSSHHVYDPETGITFLGDGERIESGAASFGPALQPFAGTGSAGGGGDGGAATSATLTAPEAVAVGPDGTVFIADAEDDRVRAVSPAGIIRTVAGTGSAGFSGDGGPAVNAQLSQPSALAVTPEGTLLIADTNNNRIRAVAPGGRIRTVAGGGSPADGVGDGALATDARLRGPRGVAVATGGGVWISDTNAHRIRSVGTDGVISTVAGTGVPGAAGDDGPAVAAELERPYGLAVDRIGRLLVAERGAGTVRRIGLDGIIERVAGGGSPDDGVGDGETATRARLEAPTTLAVDESGDVLVADQGAGRIRRVSSSGTISTVAGAGTAPGSGTAKGGTLEDPVAVATGPDDTTYVGESSAHRVRAFAARVGVLDASDITVASPDTPELYVFSPTGRHLRTLQSLTGAVLRTFKYDDAGALIGVDEGNGNLTTIVRDVSEAPVAIVGPDGARTELSTTDGLLKRITDPTAKGVDLAYDTDGQMTSLKSGGHTHAFEYDAQDRLVRDDSGSRDQRITSQQDDDRSQSTLSTVDGGSETFSTRTAEDGTVSRTRRTGDGPASEGERSDDGRLSATMEDGTTITSSSVPDARFGAGTPSVESTAITTPGGLKLRTSRQITIARPANGGTGPFDFDTLTSRDVVGSAQSTTVLDRSARTVTQTTGAGHVGVEQLDAEGRTVSERIGSELAPVQYGYDDRGRLTTSTQAGRTSTVGYDARGQVTSISDSAGGRKEIDRDASGNAKTVRRTGLPTVDFGYDDDGNTVSVKPTGRDARTMTYDADGRLTSTTEPARAAGDTRPRTTTYAFTGGRLTAVRRPARDAVGIAYTSAGDVSHVTAGARTIDLEHDDAGRVSAVDDGTTRIATEHDGPLETASVFSGAVTGRVSRTFGDDLSVTSTAVNGTTVADYRRDGDSLLTGVGPLTLDRRPGDGLVSGGSAGSLAVAYDRDALGQLTGMSVKRGGATIFAESLGRDAKGRVDRVDEGGTRTTYDRDAGGQLTKVTRGGAQLASYGYDVAGNRTSGNDEGRSSLAATYDGQDAVLSAAGETFETSDGGDVVSRRSGTGPKTTYDYDALGTLRGVDLGDGGTVRYTTDGLGRRVRRVASGEPTTEFLYGSEARGPAAQLDANGTVISTFAYATAEGAPAIMNRAGHTYLLVTDHVGSVRRVVDTDTGEVVQRLEYDAFGRVTSDSNPGFQPFGFAGGLYDPRTKLVRFGAREYDARLGRWLSQDALGIGSDTTNLYGYVNNDPVGTVDPTGHFAQLLVIAAAGCGISAGISLLCGEGWKKAAGACVAGAVSSVVGFGLGGAGGVFTKIGSGALSKYGGRVIASSAASAVASGAGAGVTAAYDAAFLPGTSFTAGDVLKEVVVGGVVGLVPGARRGVGRPVSKVDIVFKPWEWRTTSANHKFFLQETLFDPIQDAVSEKLVKSDYENLDAALTGH